MLDTKPRVMLRDMPAVCGTTPTTIYRWRKSGRLPKPDVELSTHSTWWYVETLESVGIRVPERFTEPVAG